MEGSASAPVLSNEDYRVPSDGIGLTGHPKRITMGPMSKDKGTYSSRINQIVRQAEKVPGPGKYLCHEPWEEGKTAHTIHAGNKFPNGSRDYKPMSKTPAPATYENKDFYLGKSIAGSENLSNRPRVLYGQVPKGKKRSFMDQAIAHAGKIPAPGSNDFAYNNKLPTAQKKVMAWDKEKSKTTSKKAPEKEIGPNHYQINYNLTEEKFRTHAIPKAKAQNFLDKAVKEKWVDVKSKKELPGPGTYNVHDYDDSKFSRGTKYLQLRGLTRSSVSGYF